MKKVLIFGGLFALLMGQPASAHTGGLTSDVVLKGMETVLANPTMRMGSEKVFFQSLKAAGFENAAAASMIWAGLQSAGGPEAVLSSLRLSQNDFANLRKMATNLDLSGAQVVARIMSSVQGRTGAVDYAVLADAFSATTVPTTGLQIQVTPEMINQLEAALVPHSAAMEIVMAYAVSGEPTEEALYMTFLELAALVHAAVPAHCKDACSPAEVKQYRRDGIGAMAGLVVSLKQRLNLGFVRAAILMKGVFAGAPFGWSRYFMGLVQVAQDALKKMMGPEIRGCVTQGAA